PTGEKPGPETNYGLEAPGRIIHEVGTTRMGTDKNSSVTNSYNQTHDVDNLFVMDGGVFVSQADKNPTWTILALAWRSSEYLLDEYKKMNWEYGPEKIITLPDSRSSGHWIFVHCLRTGG